MSTNTKTWTLTATNGPSVDVWTITGHKNDIASQLQSETRIALLQTPTGLLYLDLRVYTSISVSEVAKDSVESGQ